MVSEYVGKRAFITGASAGIGAEFARQLHAHGADLLLTARRYERLVALKNELERSRPHSVQIVAADLTAKEASAELIGVENLAKRIADEKIDIFINNAGIGSFGYFESIPFAHERQIIDLNVYATTRLAHAVLAQMKARRSGTYISISSVAGFEPLPYMATYAASKAFNLFQGIALRHELSDFGVKVLVVCPGPTETEFFGVARMPGKPTGVRRDSVVEVVRESLSALARNKGIVATGWRSKLMVFAVRALPLLFSSALAKRALRSSLP